MCSSFYNRLRGPISDARVQSIDAVFQGLLKAEGKAGCMSGAPDRDPECVNLDTILRCYNPRKEPSVIQNKADVRKRPQSS